MLQSFGRSLCYLHVHLCLCVIALSAIHSFGENISTCSQGVCESENEALLQKMLRSHAKSLGETHESGRYEETQEDSKRENILFQVSQTSDGQASQTRQQSGLARPRVDRKPDSADSFLQVSQRSARETRHQSGRHHSAHFVKHHMVHHDQEPPPPQHGRKHKAFQSTELTDPTPTTDPEHGSDPSEGAPGTHPRRPGVTPGPLPKVFFDDHRHMGLPQWFEQKKATARSLLFEKCDPKKKRQALPQMAVSTSNASTGSSIKVPCNSGQLVGYWNGSEFISHCCEEDYCVGCAILNATDGTCEQCMAGYVRKAVANLNFALPN